MTTNQQGKEPQVDESMPLAHGWPNAGITRTEAVRAFQRAFRPLRVCTSTPSFIINSEDEIVAQTFQRSTEELNDKDHLAEMWARACLLAAAPKMYEALNDIVRQLEGHDPDALRVERPDLAPRLN